MLQLKSERRKESEALTGNCEDINEKITEKSLDMNANVVNTPGNCFFCGQATALLCRFCQGEI